MSRSFKCNFFGDDEDQLRWMRRSKFSVENLIFEFELRWVDFLDNWLSTGWYPTEGFVQIFQNLQDFQNFVQDSRQKHNEFYLVC